MGQFWPAAHYKIVFYRTQPHSLFYMFSTVVPMLQSLGWINLFHRMRFSQSLEYYLAHYRNSFMISELKLQLYLTAKEGGLKMTVSFLYSQHWLQDFQLEDCHHQAHYLPYHSLPYLLHIWVQQMASTGDYRVSCAWDIGCGHHSTSLVKM